MFVNRFFNLFKVFRESYKVKHSQSKAEQLLAKQALVRILSETRGLSMKVGQLFADIEGENEFKSLVEGIKPFPLKQMLPVLEQGLGRPVKTVFKKIDEAVSAASLGQVHFAILLNGEKVAVKLRYPDIVAAIDAELCLADCLPSMGPAKQWGVDVDGYKTSLRNNLQRELDYHSESIRQDLFLRKIKVDGLVVPSVYSELCSEAVLVQSRASGVLLKELVYWSHHDRIRVAEILLTTLFKSLFVLGEVHGDPHAGNIFYDYDEEGQPIVYLLDYGCTVTISQQQRLALLKLMMACRLKSVVSPMDCFSAMGFDVKKLMHIQGSLSMLCHYLFLPFLSEHVFHLDAWCLGSKISALLNEKRWWFRSAGPADLLLLMRAFQGIVSQLQFLKVSLNWWDVLQRAVGHELMEQASQSVFPAIEIPCQSHGDYFSDRASKLCVQVLEHEKIIVSITLPAEAAVEIEQIMPEDILELLLESNEIDFREIMNRLVSGHLVPQQIFELVNHSKKYKVWLE